MEREFEEIYRLYAKDVYRFLVGLCKNEVLAEDILQDTMLKAVSSIDKFNGGCSLKSWLCTIAKNLYFNHLKKAETKNLPLDEASEVCGESPETIAIRDSAAVEILKQVHTLDEPYKEIFMLRFYGELKFSEIGSIFQKSENWARVCYFRAKTQLAESLDKEGLK